MTKEEKQLLLQDLSARLPYGVKVDMNFYYATKELSCDLLQDFITDEKIIRPYLRPMSSMTEGEKKEFEDICTSTAKDRAHFVMEGSIDSNYMLEKFDWLNAHHFDYRGLLLKSLALEAPEEMYVIE